MRLSVSVVLFGLGLLLIGGHAQSNGASRPPESARISGRDYVSAPRWGAGRGLSARWLRTDQTLQLRNNTSTVILKADSCEAQVNDVQVWLSYPAARSSGTLFVSRLDCDSMLDPLLRGLKQRSGEKIRTICLDPGHGGKDPGNQVGPNQEKKYTLALAHELRNQLSRAGFKVVMTRTRDSYIDLDWRPDFARRKKADLFVSLHFNSAESSRASVRGSEVYCLTPAGADSTNAQNRHGGGDWCAGNRNDPQNLTLAYLVQRSLTTRLALEDRGVRRARFAVLRDAAMPAILVEAGFMSHPAEGRKIFSASYRAQLATAICEAITAYKRLVEKGDR